MTQKELRNSKPQSYKKNTQTSFRCTYTPTPTLVGDGKEDEKKEDFFPRRLLALFYFQSLLGKIIFSIRREKKKKGILQDLKGKKGREKRREEREKEEENRLTS